MLRWTSSNLGSQCNLQATCEYWALLLEVSKAQVDKLVFLQLGNYCLLYTSDAADEDSPV